MATVPATTLSDGQPAFELTSSRQFPQWLLEQRLSCAFTTYQAGKLFLLVSKLILDDYRFLNEPSIDVLAIGEMAKHFGCLRCT